jgi:hypothetical protein
MKNNKEPDLSLPPENCPNCNGGTEWYQKNKEGKWTIQCCFCNCIFTMTTLPQLLA